MELKKLDWHRVGTIFDKMDDLKSKEQLSQLDFTFCIGNYFANLSAINNITDESLNLIFTEFKEKVDLFRKVHAEKKSLAFEHTQIESSQHVSAKKVRGLQLLNKPRKRYEKIRHNIIHSKSSISSSRRVQSS